MKKSYSIDKAILQDWISENFNKYIKFIPDKNLKKKNLPIINKRAIHTHKNAHKTIGHMYKFRPDNFPKWCLLTFAIISILPQRKHATFYPGRIPD